MGYPDQTIVSAALKFLNESLYLPVLPNFAHDIFSENINHEVFLVMFPYSILPHSSYLTTLSSENAPKILDFPLVNF